jgi:uncharacterized membrane protein YfcA
MLALAIAVVALACAGYMAVSTGGLTTLADGADPQARAQMLAGLKDFFLGMGGALILSAIAYMILDYEEDLVTDLKPAPAPAPTAAKRS